MKRSIEKDEVNQIIDLTDLLGRDPTSKEKQDFITGAINHIIERTQSGKSITNRGFRRYSKEYAKEKGVSRNDVDLTLFGDMLLAMAGETEGENSVKLKIDNDSQAIKAFAHITGFEDHPHIKDGPKRDFFGLNKKEAKEIANKIKGGDFSPSAKSKEAARKKVIDNIFDSLEITFDGQS